jgi:hypothetical protein
MQDSELKTETKALTLKTKCMTILSQDETVSQAIPVLIICSPNGWLMVSSIAVFSTISDPVAIQIIKSNLVQKAMETTVNLPAYNQPLQL